MTGLTFCRINYIDPRITCAWAKKYGVPLEKLFSKTLSVPLHAWLRSVSIITDIPGEKSSHGPRPRPTKTGFSSRLILHRHVPDSFRSYFVHFILYSSTRQSSPYFSLHPAFISLFPVFVCTLMHPDNQSSISIPVRPQHYAQSKLMQ